MMIRTTATACCLLAGIFAAHAMAGAAEPPAAATTPATAPGAVSSPAIAQIVDRVSKSRIESTIKSLPTARAPGPDAAHIAGLLETQRLLAKQLSDLGYTPITQVVPYAKRPPRVDPADPEQPKAIAPKPEWLNIWVDIPGTTAANEVLIIGAHFDAVPHSPGADDNGSGVAVLIELAHALKDVKPARTVRLMLYNLEEGGLFGSIYYVSTWKEGGKARGESIIGMLSLDSIGYFSDEPKSQQNPFKGINGMPNLEVGDFLSLCGSSVYRGFVARLASSMAAGDERCKTLRVDIFPNTIFPIMPPDLLRSDHQPFVAMGVPAVMVTDTANFRNPHYHKPTDTIDTLNFERLHHAARAIVGAASIISGVDARLMPTTAELTTKHPPVELPTKKSPAAPVAPAEPAQPNDKPSDPAAK